MSLRASTAAAPLAGPFARIVRQQGQRRGSHRDRILGNRVIENRILCMSDVGIHIRCMRCGTQMDMKDPGADMPWTPDQFWVCPKCGRHFWSTYPKREVAKPAATPPPATPPATPGTS